MNHHLKFLPPLLLLFSCSNEPQLSLADEQLALNESNTEVSTFEINNIIKSVFPNRTASRFSQEYSVNAICNFEGIPAIYVVNFANNEGFLLVSASKKHYPILAYSESGHYNLSNIGKPDNVCFWQSEMITSILTAEEFSDCNDKNWEPFSVTKTTNALGKNISRSIDDQRSEIIADSLASWLRKGFEILSIDDYEPRNESEVSTINDLRYNMYPMDSEDWKDYVFVVKYYNENNYTIPNFVHSRWQQDNGYNSEHPTVNGVHYIAGCAPVAAGQIMRYHRKPITLNWDAMPLDYPTPTTSQFLYEFGVRAKSDFGTSSTGTNYENVKKALESYGYTCKIGSYSHETVLYNIGAKRPVYMRAKDSADKNKAGHAWVISGVSDYRSSSVTRIYYFYEPATMTILLEHVDNPSHTYSHYCNWGYGGLYDGFYGMDRFDPSNRNYTIDRKIIFDIQYNGNN